LSSSSNISEKRPQNLPNTYNVSNAQVIVNDRTYVIKPCSWRR